jgi:hypothetical protein
VYTIVQCTMYIHGRLSEHFQDHRWLSEQLLVSQAVTGKPKQASWRELLEGFSQLIIDFTEASGNFIFNFLHKKAAENSALMQEVLTVFYFFGSMKNIHLSTLSHKDVQVQRKQRRTEQQMYRHRPEVQNAVNFMIYCVQKQYYTSIWTTDSVLWSLQ